MKSSAVKPKARKLLPILNTANSSSSESEEEPNKKFNNHKELKPKALKPLIKTKINYSNDPVDPLHSSQNKDNSYVSIDDLINEHKKQTASSHSLIEKEIEEFVPSVGDETALMKSLYLSDDDEGTTDLEKGGLITPYKSPVVGRSASNDPEPTERSSILNGNSTSTNGPSPQKSYFTSPITAFEIFTGSSSTHRRLITMKEVAVRLGHDCFAGYQRFKQLKPWQKLLALAMLLVILMVLIYSDLFNRDVFSSAANHRRGETNPVPLASPQQPTSPSSPNSGLGLQ
jgi:hypothetical protein